MSVAFRFLPPILGNRVGVAGGGGGKSVLSADACEEAGLKLPPLPEQVRKELKKVAPHLWDWMGNPADRSIMQGTSVNTGSILRMMAQSPVFDFLIVNLTEDAPFDRTSMVKLLGKETEDIIRVSKEESKPVIAVLGAGEFSGHHLQDWRWRLLAEQRQRLVEACIPVFSSITRATDSISRLVDYYRARALR